VKDTGLWRAQIGYEEPMGKDEDPLPLSAQRMKPIPNKATEGRANPKGIPYLYLATDKETAMAEVRPWKGSIISVGQFKTTRDLLVIDSSKHSERFTVYFKEPSPEKRELAVWDCIDNAFSRPVNASDNLADYAPTQIIAELFKSNGADGIIYRSSLGEGLNLVLFDLTLAEIVDCSVYILDKLSFKFRQFGNLYPYQVKTEKDK
jgi:hypothetical protein